MARSALLAALAAVLIAVPVEATRPGANGPLAYVAPQAYQVHVRHEDDARTYRRTATDLLDVFAMRPDGSGAVNVTRSCEQDTDPEWSPAGDRLAVTLDARNLQPGAVNTRIATYRGDGGDRRVLTDGSLMAFDPAWSPDGTRIAYATRQSTFGSGGDPGQANVRVVRADGTGDALLAGGGDAYEWAPAFSPDGTRLAYLSRSLEPGAADTLRVLDLATGASRSVYRAISAGALASPDWTPDGRSLVFYEDEGPSLSQLSRLPATATEHDARPERIVRGTRGAETGVGWWSLAPDGTQVAVDYVAPDARDGLRLFPLVADADGLGGQPVRTERVSGLDWGPATARPAGGAKPVHCGPDRIGPSASLRPPKRPSRAALLRAGLAVTIDVVERDGARTATTTGTLTLAAKTARALGLGAKALTLATGSVRGLGRRTLTLRVPKKLRSRLARARPGAFKATLGVAIADPAGNVEREQATLTLR